MDKVPVACQLPHAKPRHPVDIILDASSGDEGVTLSAAQVHALAYHITLDAEQIARERTA